MITPIDKSALFVKSKFIQMVRHENFSFIWHSLFGNLKIVPNKIMALLDKFRAPKYLDEVLNNETDNEIMTIIEELLNYFYLNPVGFDERKFLTSKTAEREIKITNGSLIDYLGLIMSEDCNFRCVYCIHFSNLKNSERINNSCKIMNFDIAKNAVDNYLLILSQHGKNIANISFNGGEPLIAWLTIKDIIEYCFSRYAKEFTFRFSLTTNASLITPLIAKEFKKYKINVASSLDGIQEGNDKVRLTNKGNGTFKEILSGFQNLKNEHHPFQIIGITVNKNNISFIDEEIIDLLIKYDIFKVHIDIDVINEIKIPTEIIAQKIMQIYRYGKTKDMVVSGYWSRPAKNLKKNALDPRGVAFCGAVQGKTICVDPLGNIYGCGYSNTRLGTLDKILSLFEPKKEYHVFVKNHSVGKVEMCKDCIIENQCGGGCYITQEFASFTKNFAKINFMCNIYRKMTRELLVEQLREIDER